MRKYIIRLIAIFSGLILFLSNSAIFALESTNNSLVDINNTNKTSVDIEADIDKNKEVEEYNENKLLEKDSEESTDIEEKIEKEEIVNEKIEKEEIENEKRKNINQSTEVNKDEKNLKDGIYVIKSAINNEYVVGIAGESKTSGANVEVERNQLLESQRFKIEYLSEGYYIITAMHSDKVLDVANGGKTAGTNVWQCYRNELDAQKWIIKEAGNGYYYIISKCNGLYLDVANGQAANGINIAVCYGNNSNAQKFKFEEYEERIPERTLEDGTYVVKSAINNEYVVGIAGESKTSGANVEVERNQLLESQRFKIEYLSEGYYIITAIHSDKVLDVANGGKTAGTNVWQCYRNELDAQKWIIKEAGNGYYYIISKCNGLYLDVANGQAANGINIAVCYGNNSNAQKFKFEEYEEKISEKKLKNGTYLIQSAINSEYVLDVNLGSKISGSNVQIYEKVLANRQRFYVTCLSDGYYIIEAIHSNMVLDVANAGKTAGTNVWQCYRNDADAQKWIIKEVGNGYYNIISKCNGLYLDVANGKAENETNIAVCYGNNSNAQKFKFIETEKVEDIEYLSGIYGRTGLMVANNGGSYQKYYKWGNGKNVFFATFAIHGWEDLWARDGQELITIAENFYSTLIKKSDINLARKWTVYIFPGINIDGITNGYKHDGPGRTTLYSDAPGNKGIDLNRCWQVGNSYIRFESDRNYNGTAGFQAFEAANLRDFLLSKKSKDGQNVLVDLHGWTQQLIGDSQICSYYQKQFPENNTSSIGRYGTGYLINWARTNLGSNGIVAKSALIELPNYGNTIYGHETVLKYDFSNRYIQSTLNLLNSI